jgi:hypothetical protein
MELIALLIIGLFVWLFFAMLGAATVILFNILMALPWGFIVSVLAIWWTVWFIRSCITGKK